MLFRVNRRPSPQQHLFSQPVPSFFDHLTEVLLFNEPFVTGRRFQRVWRLANREVTKFRGRPALSGNLGFEREDLRPTGEFDPSQGWHDVFRQVEEGAYSPFVIDSESRVLGVVRHPEFNNPNTVAEVFTGFLNQGEFRRGQAIDWAVEPVLDEDDFFEWLSRTPVVERVRFVARAPNPDAIEGHEFINARLDSLNADRIGEEISTQRDSGLRNLRQDRQAQGFVDSARQGFGYVTAQGHTQSGSRHFDQRQQLARESLEVVPGSWTALVAGLMATVGRWVAARREAEEEA